MNPATHGVRIHTADDQVSIADGFRDTARLPIPQETR
ncbi:hypothetical protein NRB20_10960 [Nocardia sp. RB20]|uniref:Uncharacterized protein n=1 Tax=Nocardia macrotermitis TaxID=2585198 RepID=A0A7K0CWY6_9NOCA|nr:hypothetical protein [Nocardia macrotermitis]